MLIRAIAASALLAHAALAHGPAAFPPDDPHALVRIHLDSWDELEALERAGAEPMACRIALGDQLFAVGAETAAQWAAAGDAHILIPDITAHLNEQLENEPDPAPRGASFFDAYQTFETIDARLDLYAQDPRVAIVEVGLTLEGRMVRGVRITGDPGDPPKPAVLVNGGQHAREWISPASTMYLIEQLLSGDGTSPAVTTALDGVDFYVIPVVNADGYAYSWTPGNRFWRKNRRPNPDGSFGVDPNRNWSEGWGLSTGSSGFPSSAAYRGPFPFSEPCTDNLRAFIESRPEIRAHVDVHNFAQLLLGAWAYTNDPAPYPETLLPLGEAINLAIVLENGADYDFETGAGSIGFASGAMPDWTFGELGVMSWTLELRDQGQFGFTLPASEIIPTSEEAFAGILRLARQIAECPADLNIDGVINAADLAILISRWNEPRGLTDVDLSGQIDAADLARVISMWGMTCSF